MLVYLNPSRSDNKQIDYSFDGDVVYAHANGEVKKFDFTECLDGEMVENEQNQTFPILEATKVNGELKVVLKYYHGKDADESVTFPKWVDSTELVKHQHGDKVVTIPFAWKSLEQINREREEEERLASLPSELQQLQAQIKASNEYTDFLEEVIVEIAQKVY